MVDGLAAVARGRLLALVLATCAPLALAPAASAQGPSLVDSATDVVETTVESAQRAPDEVAETLAGEQGAATAVSDLACPPARSVEDLLRAHGGDTPLGDAGASLAQVVCSFGLIELQFQTKWVSPGGETIERVHDAVAGVPAALDVDDDAAPDLVGTISLIGSDSAGLSVERATGENATLPVQVEAILTDDSRRVIGREHLAFGYDAREDRAPGRFDLTTPVGELLDPNGEYAFDIAQQQRGERIAVVGALFDGEPTERRDPSEVRIDYGAAPDTATIRARANDQVRVALTTNRPGPATISGRAVDGETQDDVAIELEDLPESLTLTLDQQTGQITYDASAPVERLHATANTAEPVFLGAQHFEATFLAVPQAFELALGSGGGDVGLTSTEPIGQIDFRARSEGRSYPEIPAGEAGAVVHATDGLALALRVFQLRMLQASTDPIRFETDMQGGRVFTIDAKLPADGGPTEANVVFDKMPAQLTLAVDSATGKLTYAGSDTIDRLAVAIHSAQPLFMGAGDVEATLLAVPQAFDLTVGQDGGGFDLTADNPIGQIDLRAHSPNRSFPSLPAGEAGAVLDATAGELALALRVFELRRMAVDVDPLRLETDMERGRRFTADVRLDGESGPIDADAVIDKLPAQLTVAMEDLAAGGSRLRMTGSEPIDFLRLATDGLELLPGADRVQVELNDVPTGLTVELPETGRLADISTSGGRIGQIRLVASNGSASLPARSIAGDPVLNDLVRFRNRPSEPFQIAARLTAIGGVGIDLDPINLTLQQDAARTRPIDIDAAFRSGTSDLTVTGLLNKPSATTSVSVVTGSGQPTKLLFQNAANVGRLSLRATGLSAAPLVDATLDNLPRRLNVCLDSGGGCQRPNPNGLSGGTAHNNRPYPAQISMDFDDQGTQGTSQFTTLNAVIDRGSGDPIRVTNLRFRNLGLDFGTGSNFSYLGTTLPRMYMFMDSRRHQFVMNEIRFPPQIQAFRIGTDSQPARANNRIVWLKGTKNFGLSLDTAAAGGLDCGGRRDLIVRLLGIDFDLLDFLGTQILPVCGGTV